MIIGIDIGTTFSSVAILKNGRAEKVKPVSNYDYSVPSAIYMEADGKILLGRAAKASRMKDPSRYKDNFKRDFGTHKPYLLGNQQITPDEIYTEFFRFFRQNVEKAYGEEVTKAYITHPVGYSAEKKLLLEEAAVHAGLSEYQLLDEPTAAAVSYFTDHMPRKGETLLVYDLGGGTLDLTLIQMEEHGFRLLAEPVGDTHLGGADFDLELYEEIKTLLEKSAEEYDAQEAFRNSLTKAKFNTVLFEAATEAKINLTGDVSALVSVPFGQGDSLDCIVERSRFETLLDSYMKKGDRMIASIAKSAGMIPAKIDKVLCVGGSTRIPYVRQRVEEMVCKPVLVAEDPELAVCLGAALSEEILFNTLPREQKEMTKEWGNLSAEQWSKKAWDYQTGKGIPKNPKKAFVCFTLAAEEGDVEAQHIVGYCYESGEGTSPSPSQAVKWYRKAASGKSTKAQFDLGRCLHFGIGVEKNETEAVKWYRIAADKGDGSALCSLGYCYEHGQGMRADRFQALGWYRKAADKGNAMAQYNAGVLLETGQSNVQDRKEALKQAIGWYQKAANQGHEKAKKRLKRLQQQTA
jgi:hypothetical protein